MTKPCFLQTMVYSNLYLRRISHIDGEVWVVNSTNHDIINNIVYRIVIIKNNKWHTLDQKN